MPWPVIDRMTIQPSPSARTATRRRRRMSRRRSRARLTSALPRMASPTIPVMAAFAWWVAGWGRVGLGTVSVGRLMI